MKNKKIKVAHIINSLEYGGAEKVLVNIANNEDLREIQPLIFSLSNKNPLQEELSSKIPFFFFEKCPVFDVFLVYRLYRQFRKEHIDIIHIHGWGVYPEAFVAATLARIRVKIVMDHGRVTAGGRVKQKKSLYKYLKNFILKFFIQNTTAFIAVSQDIKESMIYEKKIPADKIYVVHNGIPNQFSSTISDKKRSIVKELKNKNNSFVLCSVGRLAKIKNYNTLIQAFKIVCADVPAMKLIILGDGPERNHLEELIFELELSREVLLPGFNSNIFSNIKHADIFILPSFFEGISISLLEAMSAGLPIIASNVGGNVEVIDHNNNGLLFSPDNKNELVKCIKELFENKEKRNQFSKNNIIKFTNTYSMEIALKKYHTLYYKFLG